jgi:hypothetical protein
MLEKVIEFFPELKYLALAVAIVPGLVFNAKNIIAFIDTFKKRRLDLLKEAMSHSANEKLKSHYEDEIEGEYFRIAHKAKMDKGMRDACIEFYLEMEKRIPFSHFIQARHHLEAPDGHLRVNITPFDKVGYYYNAIAGLFLLLIGFILITLIKAIELKTAIHLLLWIGMSMTLMMFGFFLLTQTASVTSAKKIQKFTDV